MLVDNLILFMEDLPLNLIKITDWQGIGLQ